MIRSYPKATTNSTTSASPELAVLFVCFYAACFDRKASDCNAGFSLVLERRQALQYLRRPRPIHHRIVFPDFSVPENQNAFSELSDVVLMRDQHDRQPLFVQILKNLHDLHRRPAIQIPRRLVRQQNRWTIHQRPCNGHSLLLPSGHLRRKMLRPFRQDPPSLKLPRRVSRVPLC